MIKDIIIIAGLFCVVLIFAFFDRFMMPKTARIGIVPTNKISQSGLQKVIGWIPYWDQDNAALSFKAHANQLGFISFFWYRIDPNGAVTTYQSTMEDQSLITFAHGHNVRALALIANMVDFTEKGQWDDKRVDLALSSSEKRKKHIGQILDLVEKRGFDGVDIDYEALRSDQKDMFSSFIEELAFALHKRGKILGVAVFPVTSVNDTSQAGVHAQDLQRIAKAADQLYFMTYLEHGTFSDPGPPGDIHWIEDTLNFAVSEGIEKNKIFMGIGLMGVAWRKDPGGNFQGDREDIPFQEILGIVQKNKVSSEWDDVSRTPHIQFGDSTGTHVLWYENNESIKQRIALAKKLGIGGLAFWRLGGEDQAMWGNVP